MLNDLGFSAAVASRMYQPRALGGTQFAEGKRALASWLFTWIAGYSIVFEKKR